MKKLMFALLLFVIQTAIYAQNPPPPDGGAGGTTPGNKVVSVDMYVPLFIIVIVVLVGFYSYNREKFSK